MTIHTYDDAYEPAHSASQTAHALDELQLYGFRPFDGPDPRPMPDGQRLAVAVADEEASEFAIVRQPRARRLERLASLGRGRLAQRRLHARNLVRIRIGHRGMISPSAQPAAGAALANARLKP